MSDLAQRLRAAAYKPFRDTDVYDECIDEAVVAVLRELADFYSELDTATTTRQMGERLRGVASSILARAEGGRDV